MATVLAAGGTRGLGGCDVNRLPPRICGRSVRRQSEAAQQRSPGHGLFPRVSLTQVDSMVLDEVMAKRIRILACRMPRPEFLVSPKTVAVSRLVGVQGLEESEGVLDDP